ncbi:hypothetical protein SAMN05421659_11168 [[Clostridium] fimetarium]|uniref:Uncharacterized protein n=1 Tax=[Clostridium] fimetarium TaxID=99656 RepID=A0A1I0R277_9FIRM|nr:hypothetical protein SAMN05421659_11168 [[Clostridium] fimetarium]
MAVMTMSVLSALYIIYNIICYFKENVIYSIRKVNLVIINHNFFKIQLYLSCVNAVVLTIIIYVWDKFDLRFFFVPMSITFFGINYLIKYIARLKKYVE